MNNPKPYKTAPAIAKTAFKPPLYGHSPAMEALGLIDQMIVSRRPLMDVLTEAEPLWLKPEQE